MLEALTLEMLVTGSLAAASGVAMLGGYLLAQKPRMISHDIDIDAAVRDAPWHRLQGIVQVREA